MLEATMIAATTSQRFVLDAAPGHRVVEKGFTTLRPKSVLPMVIWRRT
jgi:hypothetical protein